MKNKICNNYSKDRFSSLIDFHKLIWEFTYACVIYCSNFKVLSKTCMMKYKKYRVESPDEDVRKVFPSILDKNNRSKNVYRSIFSCLSLHK